MKTPVSSAAALALASVLCVPSLAMAQPTLNVADTASLIAGGSGALVSLEITCPTETNNVRLEVPFSKELRLATPVSAALAVILPATPSPRPSKLPYKLIPYDSNKARLPL